MYKTGMAASDMFTAAVLRSVGIALLKCVQPGAF